MERTFVMLKPDGVQRGLIGEVVNRFEKRGFKLIAAKFIIPSEDLLKTHYKEHEGKKFYQGLIDYVHGPCFAMVWEAKNVIAAVRKMVGATNPQASENGTIRGDFAIETGRNIIHASDATESATREIALWFKQDEVFDKYKASVSQWVYE